jgi:hypothetical protein
MSQVRAKLTEWQGSRTGGECARELGISGAQWSRLKSGDRVLSLKLFGKLVKRIPDLAEALKADVLAGESDAA